MFLTLFQRNFSAKNTKKRSSIIFLPPGTGIVKVGKITLGRKRTFCSQNTDCALPSAL